AVILILSYAGENIIRSIEEGEYPTALEIVTHLTAQIILSKFLGPYINKTIISGKGTGGNEILFKTGTRVDAMKSVDNLPKGIKNSATKFFKDKATNKYTDFIVEKLTGGNYMLKMTKPGNVPGSKAIYYKKVSPCGKTLDVFKETYDPSGNLVHNKNKIN
ncbi:hypothetical protein RBH29_17580, partial [Herbivorax sp. ANBcel31]|uniref:hypothetical protein n=1 Tax=Herbivorax sp. ANBcel31 TaxID=3069754 RepID=UPI0027B57C1F